MPRLFQNDSMIRPFGFFLVFLAVFGLALGVVSTSVVLPDSAVIAQDEEGGDEVEKQLDNAGDGGDSTEEPAKVGDSYLVWYVKALGPIFAPAFAVTSIIFVMLVIMNWMAITRKNMIPQDLVDRFKELLEEQNFQEAYEVAKENESPQGKILAAGLAKMSAGYEAAQQAMSDVAEEEITRMEQKLGYLALVGGIAPMLGLLGTVYGMVASFQVIAVSGSAPQASELAGGISTALITTEVGLFIAIPATIVYEIFRNKLALLVLELTVQTENLMNRFKS